jgi:hypothetical protein
VFLFEAKMYDMVWLEKGIGKCRYVEIIIHPQCKNHWRVNGKYGTAKKGKENFITEV